MFKSIVKRGQFLFLISFVALILTGTLLLHLPIIHKSGEPLRWIDALFMATTSVCVTGLTTVSLSDFTWFGQLVITILIQLGGLGIMTLSASILLAVGKGLSFSNSLMVSRLNDNFSLRGSESLTRTVIRYTLWCEAIGFVIIFTGFMIDRKGEILLSLWQSIMLSVSGFCNAGLSPFPDSLINCHWITQFGVCCEGILGGLGVYVIYDILQVVKKNQMHIRVHSKIVLTATLILLFGGTLLLKISGTKTGCISWWDSFFMSATSRTAGFNTIAMNDLPKVSAAILAAFMMIGVAPGSTGGGMKVTTVFLALAAIWSTVSGNRDVLCFKRKIPMEIVLRSFAIIVIFVILCVGGMMLIDWVNHGGSTEKYLFESISALTTTGLSYGVSAGLDLYGKIVLVLLMFLGRVGPFTILLFFVGREKPGHLQYPSERVIIG